LNNNRDNSKDRFILVNIQEYDEASIAHPLSLPTNGGPFKCKLVGRFPGLAKAHVWYKPHAIINVFALLDIVAELRGTIDSVVKKCFRVHCKGGSIMKFANAVSPTSKRCTGTTVLASIPITATVGANYQIAFNHQLPIHS